MGLGGGAHILRPASLADLLVDRAACTPDRIAFTMLRDGETATESLTYGELFRAVWVVAAKLASSLQPGTRVLLLYPPGYGHIIGLFGCLSAGMTPVSGLPPQIPRAGPDGSRHRRKLERVLSVMRTAQVGAVLGETTLLEGFQAALADQITDVAWIDSSGPGGNEGSSPASATVAPSPETPALLQYTSGSTGEARGVVVTHAQLLHNLQAQEAAFELTREDVCVSWLPFSHDMGLIFAALAMLYVGGRTILMAPSHFTERPIRWLRAMSDYGGTVSAAPNFAYELCARRISPEERGDLDLRRWRFALNGAEPVSRATIDRFCEAFADAGFRPGAMRPGYGLAEATLAVSIRRSADALTTLPCRRGPLALGKAEPDSGNGERTLLTSCGRIVPGLTVTIVDEAGTALADGSIGEIWVKGPSVASGYYRKAQETEAVFGARLRNGDGPYLRTGDLGFLWNGELYVAGRLKDVMIFRGINYYPSDLEAEAALRSPAIPPNGTVAFSVSEDHEEQLVVLIEIGRAPAVDAPALAGAVRRAMLLEFGLDAHAVGLVPIGGLPKTPSGKIQRRLARELFQAGALRILYEDRRAGVRPHEGRQGLAAPGQAPPASRREVEAWLAAWIGPWGAGATAAADLTDLGLNSLHVAHLTADLQQRFNVPLTIAELFEQRTLGGIADLVWDRCLRPASDPAPHRPTVLTSAGSHQGLMAQQLRRRASRRALADEPNTP